MSLLRGEASAVSKESPATPLPYPANITSRKPRTEWYA